MPLRRWRWLRMMRARAAAARACPELEQALRTPLPRPSERIRETRLLAIDLEMTGLDPQSDSILTMGWVPVDAGGIVLDGAGEVAVAATAGEAVGDSATIHGIRDCDRDRGVGSDAALTELVNALAGRVALFHHAPLDTGFLDHALRETFGIGWLWPAVDTLAWFRARQLGRDDETVAASTRLDAVRAHYGLAPRSSHNASKRAAQSRKRRASSLIISAGHWSGRFSRYSWIVRQARCARSATRGSPTKMSVSMASCQRTPACAPETGTASIAPLTSAWSRNRCSQAPTGTMSGARQAAAPAASNCAARLRCSERASRAVGVRTSVATACSGSAMRALCARRFLETRESLRGS